MQCLGVWCEPRFARVAKTLISPTKLDQKELSTTLKLQYAVTGWYLHIYGPWMSLKLETARLSISTPFQAFQDCHLLFFCWDFPRKHIEISALFRLPAQRQVQPAKVLPAAKVRGGTDLIIVRNVDKLPELQRWQKARSPGLGDGMEMVTGDRWYFRKFGAMNFMDIYPFSGRRCVQLCFLIPKRSLGFGGPWAFLTCQSPGPDESSNHPQKTCERSRPGGTCWEMPRDVLKGSRIKDLWSIQDT